MRFTPAVSSGALLAAVADGADQNMEDDEDFTLLIGMDEGDSSGDEEVLEEG